MRIGSLFSGIGGLELGLEMAGVGRTVWQVEQNEFCRGVLTRHWPGAERFDDVRTVGAHNLDPVDLICGGFPCTDISSAGKGAGLAGERSGLWFEFARIVGELRPEWVIVENVASGAARWVDQVVAGLESLGYQTLPIPLSAADVGAPHLRRRIFVVAHTNRFDVREQPGRGGGPNGEGTPQPGKPGKDGAAAHTDAIGRDIWAGDGRHRTGRAEPSHGDGNTDAKGKPAQPIDGQMARVHSVAGCAPAWAIAPEFRRVDDGDPIRVDRLKALGNAVVPQMAEVVGHVILELAKGTP